MEGAKAGMKHIVSNWKARSNLGQLHDFFYPEIVSSMKSELFMGKVQFD